MPDAHNSLRGRDAAAAIALALLVLVTGSLRMAPGVCGSFHDDAIYVSTAEALASGQGYRLIGVPGAPIQTKYPILYPALLSVVWYVWPSFPENVVAMQVLTVCFGGAAVAVGYLYLVRFGYASRTIAAAAGAICATAPYFLYFAAQTMAEMPFTLFLLVALWGVESFLLRENMTRRAQSGWGAALALPFLCRSIGATLVVSSLWVLHRNRRPLGWYAAGAACAAAPWILWSLAGRGIWDQNPVDGYYTDYLGCWSSTGVAMVGRVFSRNLLMTAHGTGELPLEGLSASLGPWLGQAVTSVLMIVVGLSAWLAMIGDLRRNRALAWMLAGYLGAMLVWSWPPYRFLVPIMPLLVTYMLRAPATVLQAVSQPKRQRGTIPFCSEDCAKSRQSPSILRLASAVCLGVIVLANGVLLARHAEQVRETGYPLARLSDAPVHWSSYERTFAWLRQYAAPQDVVASGLDSMVSLYTDRRAFRPFVYDPGRLFYGEGQPVLLTPPELAAILKRYRPRYLVQSPMPGFMEEHPLAKLIEELRQQYPTWLTVAYQDANPRFVVYELDAKHEPAEL